MSSASTDQAFGPGAGPTIYLSYTHFDESARIMPEVVIRLQEAGFRAMTDQSWTPEMVADPVGTVRRLCDAADWRIAIATPTYLERAKTLGTGIRCDLDVIGRFIVDRPMTSIRNGVVVESSSGELPLELLGGGKSGWSRELGVESLANAILNIVDNPPETIDEPTPITQIWQSNWNRDMRRVLEMVGNASDKFKRPPDITKLFAPLFVGDTAVTEIRLLPSSAYKMMARWLDDESERQWSAAFGPLRWASLAANTIGHSAPAPIHVAIGLLHAEAPWTEDVSTLLQSVQIAPNQVREILVGFAQRTQKIDALTDLVELAHRAFRLEGSSPELAFRTLDVPVRKRPVAQTGPEPIVAPAPNVPPRTPPRPPAPSKLPTPLSKLAQPDRGYARLDPDLAYGKEDQLDITGDVEALAKMIAAWKLEPPLAVGLFGDWGSGKTFFMNKLREKVASLSKEARERTKTLQKSEAFCKYIAQVEFNAWHYSEGDLWASMVHHIFANLKIKFPDEDESELAVRRKQAIAAVTKAETAVVQKAEALAKSEEEVKHKENVQKETERAAEEAVRTLSVTKADLVTLLQSDVTLRDQAKAWLSGAGIDASTLQTADQIHKALLDARREGMTTLGLLRQLRADFRERRGATIFAYTAMLGLPALATVVFTTNSWLQQHVNTVVQSLVTIAPGALSAITYFSRAAVRLSHALDEPRRKIMEAQREKVASAQKAVDDAKTQRDAARRELDEAKHRVEKERKELHELSPTKILSDFLSERAGSKDYRDKLGMLAMIRGDFDRLSNLMLDQRKADLSDEACAPNENEFCLNRIVLYIDDLDRCEPDRVVKVLQAVHLLLAFPLFVVVVGVDARWVQRSLRKEYKLLLRNEGKDAKHDGNPDNDDDASNEETIASPRDYLEKIFQIPLWLPKLTSAAQKKLIRSLIDGDAAPTAEKRTEEAAQPNTSPSNIGKLPTPTSTPPSRTTETNTTEATARQLDAKTTPTSPEQPDPPARERQIREEKQEQAKPESPETLDHLKLEPGEIKTMEYFAALCGRSPRAIKRYVNCYRLFKAMLHPTGENLYTADAEPGQAPYELALLMLAMVVGTPLTAYKFIELLRDPANHSRTFDEALRSLDPIASPNEPSDREIDEWKTLTPYLYSELDTEPESELESKPVPLPRCILDEDTQAILFRIWRFSFRSGESLGRKVSRNPVSEESAASQ